MKKFLFVFALCMAVCSCRHDADTYEGPDVIVDNIKTVSFFSVLNVKNETAEDIKVDFVPLERHKIWEECEEDKLKTSYAWRYQYDYNRFSSALPTIPPPIRTSQKVASAVSESQITFRASSRASGFLRDDNALSFVIDIREKIFTGMPANSKFCVHPDETEYEIITDEENCYFGVADFSRSCFTADAKSSKFNSHEDIPVVHYNVVITDDNVDFSFDRVEFVNANEIPREYWN